MAIRSAPRRLLEGEGGEPVAGTDFQEDGGGLLAEGAQPLGEADRAQQMAHPVAGIDGVGGGDPGAGGVRDPGDAGRAQLEAGDRYA